MSDLPFVALALSAIALISVVALLFIQGERISDLEHRMQELNCVHYIYEDGDAVHIDAEVALDCLRRHLGAGWHETDLP